MRAAPVLVTLNGHVAEVEMSRAESVPADTRRVRLDAPFHCTGGVRHVLCPPGRGSGAHDRQLRLESDELARDVVLACQTHPVAGRVVLTYDAWLRTTLERVTTAALHDLSPIVGQLFEAVLFDLDGTLIDSTPSVVRSWLAWAQEFGVDPERLVGHHGVPAAQIVAQVLPAERAPTGLARIVELESADVEGILLLPGAAEALQALAAGRCAIVTSCTRTLAAARIAATGLRAPVVVVTADDVETGKPDPAPYLLGAERLGVDPARCLVVEDAPSGLLAGRLAGAVTLAVTTTTPAEELRADAVVDDLAGVTFSQRPDGVRVAAREPLAARGAVGARR